MRLATPHSAIMSAVIFNALIIVALIPLALNGVRYRAIGAVPFIGIKLIDLILVALRLTRPWAIYGPRSYRSPSSP